MEKKWNIAAVSGSNRVESVNHRLIKSIADLAINWFKINLFQGMPEIPPFNPDLDKENPPLPVINFRNFLREADAVLICTPEYAAGVPGTLKNAIDWTVSSMELAQKPTALITAATSGYKAHQSLLGTLLILEALLTNDLQVVIPFVKTKISVDNKITDEETLTTVLKLIKSLDRLIATNARGDRSEAILRNEGIGNAGES